MGDPGLPLTTPYSLPCARPSPVGLPVNSGVPLCTHTLFSVSQTPGSHITQHPPRLQRLVAFLLFSDLGWSGGSNPRQTLLEPGEAVVTSPSSLGLGNSCTPPQSSAAVSWGSRGLTGQKGGFGADMGYQSGRWSSADLSPEQGPGAWRWTRLQLPASAEGLSHGTGTVITEAGHDSRLDKLPALA